MEVTDRKFSSYATDLVRVVPILETVKHILILCLAWMLSRFRYSTERQFKWDFVKT